jgi:hypothetical protein
MKNKKLIYVLLPATILIWGFAFMRIYNYIFPGKPEEIAAQQINSDNVQEYITDTFSININYRDPFLGKSKQIITKEKPLVQIKQTNIVPVKKDASWPVIHYTGMIKNQKSSKQLAMLQINGTSSIMRAGEVNENVKLNRIFKDSVEIIFEKQKRIIRK